MDVSNISQIAKVVETASSLTKRVQSSVNSTQPFSSSIISEVLKDSVTLASAFSTNLGSSQVNTPAVASIASKMVGVGDTPFGLGSGSITGPSSNTSFLDGASASLSADIPSFGSLNGLGEIAPGVNYFNSEGMSEVLNASFADGVSILGTAGSPLGGSGADGGLTVENILDPQTIPSDWVFITAPQDIGWDKQGAVSTIDNFGTNSPYVIYSSTGMRKLTMSDVLIEGFSAGKEVEDHIIKLESMMSMVMNGEVGYVSPYVWDLRAGDKSYGNFIIESLNIKEVMRNKKGRADRATASITLQQVPDFQINDGRDLATQADLASGKSIVSNKDKAAGKAGKAGKKVKGGTGTTGSGSGGSGGSGGDDGPSSSTDSSPRPINSDADNCAIAAAKGLNLPPGC